MFSSPYSYVQEETVDGKWKGIKEYSNQVKSKMRLNNDMTVSFLPKLPVNLSFGQCLKGNIMHH